MEDTNAQKMYRNKSILLEIISYFGIHNITDVINEIFNIVNIAEDVSKSIFVILNTKIGATPYDNQFNDPHSQTKDSSPNVSIAK